MGIDLGAVRKCIESHCGKERQIMQERPDRTPPSTEPRNLIAHSDVRRLIFALESHRLSAVPLLEAAATTPVVRQAKKRGSNENMFIMLQAFKPCDDETYKQ